MRLSFAPSRPAAAQEIDVVVECLRSGWLTMGPRVQQFEQAFQAATGITHAVAVSSETAALHLALLVAGVRRGDDVLVPAVGGAPAAAAVRRLDARPIACDVAAPEQPHLDVEDADRRSTTETAAVVAVHAGGWPMDLRQLRSLCDRRGLRLVEDATGALGAPGVGVHGDVGAFSLSAGRQVDAGTGGVVTAPEASVAERVRLLRSHAMTSGTWDRHRGQAAGYDVVDVGFNARLDEMRAALAQARLADLPAELRRRSAVASRYRSALVDALGVVVAPEDGSAHDCLLVLADAPHDLHTALAADGIETRTIEPLADLPRAAELARRGLELPVAGLSEEDAAWAATRLLATVGRSR